MNGGLNVPTPIVSSPCDLQCCALVAAVFLFRGLLKRTASSAEGVCLVMAFAEAGGSFRHIGQGNLSESTQVSGQSTRRSSRTSQ
jgi:hypothetical protein